MLENYVENIEELLRKGVGTDRILTISMPLLFLLISPILSINYLINSYKSIQLHQNSNKNPSIYIGL